MKLFLALGVLFLAGCWVGASPEKNMKPATVQVSSNGELPLITLTAEAESRLGIVVLSSSLPRSPSSTKSLAVVPVSSVVYDVNGDAGLYRLVGEHTYQRLRVEVVSREKSQVTIRMESNLNEKIVSVGAAELFGIESGVGQ